MSYNAWWKTIIVDLVFQAINAQYIVTFNALNTCFKHLICCKCKGAWTDTHTEKVARRQWRIQGNWRLIRGFGTMTYKQLTPFLEPRETLRKQRKSQLLWNLDIGSLPFNSSWSGVFSGLKERIQKIDNSEIRFPESKVSGSFEKLEGTVYLPFLSFTIINAVVDIQNAC